MTRPNILITFADDQRHDMVGCLGDPNVRTPHLDRLCDQGTAFTRAHHLGSLQGAVCVPSRAMLHTGTTLFHTNNHMEAAAAPGDFSTATGQPHRTLGQILQGAGYRTFATGKWHNGRASHIRSFDFGGKIFFGGMSSHDSVPTYDFDPEGTYPKDNQYVGEAFSSDMFAGAANGFLNDYEGDAPFFLYVAFTAPHDPRTPPEGYTYDPDSVPLPPNFMTEHPFDNGMRSGRDEDLAAHPRTESEVRQHIADYYGMVTHMDERIGRIHDTLEKSGHADNTILIHTGDHGLGVGQHGLLGKQNVYDHSIRMPLIVRGPGIQAGRRTDALCYQHDLFPTLLEAAGADIPTQNEFRSLVPVLTGGADTLRDSIYCAYGDYMRTVKDERFKVIEYLVEGARRTQLFDLDEDPAETNDLSGEPAHTDRIAALRARLAEWQTRLDDPLDLQDLPQN